MKKKPTANVIPARIAELAPIVCAESKLSALGGIHISTKKGRYEAVATDCRAMVILDGACEAAPPVDVTLRLDDLQAARLVSQDKEIAIVQDGESVKLIADGDRVIEARPISGQFPSYRDVLPHAEPTVSVCIDPRLMIRVLEVAAKFAWGRVVMEIRESDSPIVIRGYDSTAEPRVTAVVMPCELR